MPAKKVQPKRCSGCGGLYRWPEGSTMCYGCHVREDDQERTQGYIRESTEPVWLGAITSERRSPGT
jgi:hypothetical protein